MSGGHSKQGDISDSMHRHKHGPTLCRNVSTPNFFFLSNIDKLGPFKTTAHTGCRQRSPVHVPDTFKQAKWWQRGNGKRFLRPRRSKLSNHFRAQLEQIHRVSKLISSYVLPSNCTRKFVGGVENMNVNYTILHVIISHLYIQVDPCNITLTSGFLFCVHQWFDKQQPHERVDFSTLIHVGRINHSIISFFWWIRQGMTMINGYTYLMYSCINMPSWSVSQSWGPRIVKITSRE